jgi:putative transposase
MSIRLTSFVEGEYYHIYNRGNSKQIIFNDNQDHEHFIHLLTTLNTQNRVRIKNEKETEKGDTIVSVGAYCLMPNHFHILITQEKENGISTFMQKVSTAYVMYYNKKYKRTGSLFEGKFKAKYISGDIYLRYLFSYIHLNPLKILDANWKKKVRTTTPSKMFTFLQKYPYSSFHEYLSDEFLIINKASFPDYFPTKKLFIENILSWFKEGAI